MFHAWVCQAEKDYTRQKASWAVARKTLQAQQSSLQDECNDLAAQLAEKDQQIKARDERISRLTVRLEDANLPSTSRRVTQVAINQPITLIVLEANRGQ